MSRTETLFPGAFDNIKTNAGEVASLWNEAAFSHAVYPASEAEIIHAAMERIEEELGNVRLRLAYSRSGRA